MPITTSNKQFWTNGFSGPIVNAPLVSEFKEQLKNKLGHIPTIGFIAGSFPANFVINTVCPDLALESNDIDLFLPGTTPLRIEEDDQGLIEPHYGGLLGRIISITREGILNTIIFEENGLTAENLLSVFDINLCQAAYDCATQRLHITEELLQFINTKEMQVTRLDSPLFTAARVLRKKAQLNVACDIDLELYLLAQASGAGKVMETQVRLEKEHCQSIMTWLGDIRRHIPLEVTDTHINIQPLKHVLKEFRNISSPTQLKDALLYTRSRAWRSRKWSTSLDI